MKKNNLIVKRERFKSVAGKRVQKVLDSLDNLSKCANKKNYDYGDEDILKMMKAIKERLKVLETEYSSKVKSAKNSFKF